MRDRMEVPVLVGLAGRGTQGRAVAVVLAQQPVLPILEARVERSTDLVRAVAAAVARQGQQALAVSMVVAVVPPWPAERPVMVLKA